MSDKKPYWYQLISYWVKDKKRTGLTIPFIIGAQQYFDSTSEPETVTELMELIKNSEIDETIILNNCPNVGEYVLGISKNAAYLSGIEFKNEKNEKITLKATSSTKILGEDFNSICKSLEKKYKKPINEKNYSKVDFNWSPFTDGDIDMIDEAKSK